MSFNLLPLRFVDLQVKLGCDSINSNFHCLNFFVEILQIRRYLAKWVKRAKQFRLVISRQPCTKPKKLLVKHPMQSANFQFPCTLTYIINIMSLKKACCLVSIQRINVVQSKLITVFVCFKTCQKHSLSRVYTP